MKSAVGIAIGAGIALALPACTIPPTGGSKPELAVGEPDTSGRIRQSEVTRIVYETGEPPQTRPAETEDGRLEVPTDYPLQPGDAELWQTLTLDQQERALAFLQSGGTIRSSLGSDE